jgi:hypothetical protein
MYFAGYFGHSAVVAVLLRAEATAERQTGAATAARHAVAHAAQQEPAVHHMT